MPVIIPFLPLSLEALRNTLFTQEEQEPFQTRQSADELRELLTSYIGKRVAVRYEDKDGGAYRTPPQILTGFEVQPHTKPGVNSVLIYFENADALLLTQSNDPSAANPVLVGRIYTGMLLGIKG